ncbi:pepsin/retropepsin-like aspartic protease family protein [Mucilaginibacter sp. X5P1]|uniref:pepsin/retropepsin-like aspartic protease family protein n=1 Tax=Mucilaginibacter sp. X5P1 TaxID=2723088 RepID=UPI00161391C6|nr:pepsin/retropepsin-like aspartic protease family protein [Mucilaginibacter sp. X5P1]MBB6136748.1 hypothetical protein [Mucilaginibacter sp. X5P1]
MRKFLFYLLTVFVLSLALQGKCVGKITIGGISFKHTLVDIDPAPYGDFKTLIVPIKRAGNLIIVEAQVDSLEGNFVFDTGAPYLVLNATYFRDAPQIHEQHAAGINGEADNTFTTVVHDFSILDLHYSRLTADVTDLSGIENGRGIKILGLLGTRLFSRLAVTIDLQNNLLYIHKLDNDGNIPPEEVVFHNPTLKTPFKFLDDIIFLKGSINDKSMWFVFDSGAETNLLDYGKSKKIIKNMQIINRSKLVGVGGSSFEVLYARFDKLTIGDQDFMHNRILITNLEKMGKAYDHTIDGILGYDFFTRGVFSINFVKKEFEMYIYNNQ